MYTKLIVATALSAVFSSTVQAEPLFAQMVLQGVTFQVESHNNSSINQVIVRANMPEGSLGQMHAQADGTITNIEIEDLNADGFPVYLDGDNNAEPTGGTRQIQYKLETGKTGWVLRQVRRM